MTHPRFNFLLGLFFLLLFIAVVLWQTPSLWQPAMSTAEIEEYVSQMEKNLVQPAAEKAGFIARVREWAAGDDGKPVLMVNLMRYRDQLGPLPEGVQFRGTPQQANELYEQRVAPLALKRGEYPLVGGETQAGSLTGSGNNLKAMDRVVVMRAPNRRAFMDFMADPAYGPNVAYKHAATEVVLIPADAGLIIPDLRWLTGSLLLVLYLLVLWRRAERALKLALA
jgi:uncharacterized protein (DUF1330 family)